MTMYMYMYMYIAERTINILGLSSHIREDQTCNRLSWQIGKVKFKRIRLSQL